MQQLLQLARHGVEARTVDRLAHPGRSSRAIAAASAGEECLHRPFGKQ
jgi:hypothetical protein